MNIKRNKRYIEEYARHTLCYICGQDIKKLFCKDKPDIQDITGEYGIEVVMDVYKDEQEREVFIEQVWNTPYDQIDPQKIMRFQTGGGEIITIENKIHSATLGKETPNNPSHLLETIKKKIELLNSGNYQKFDSYGLYVFVDTVFIDENFDSYVFEIINEVSKFRKEKTFQTIYLDYHYGICVCDIVNKKFNRFLISQSERDIIDKETKSSCWKLNKDRL